jgi:tetratricopeptide (TPR) repeat protein
METFLLLLVLIPIAILRYYTTDHDTPADKDRQRFAEGIELVLNRQYEEALSYFALMLQRYPKSAVAYLYRGRINYASGNYYSALYDLTQAATLDNTLPEIYYYKGLTHYELGESNAAFLEFDKAVWHSRSQDSHALRGRALARWALGQQWQAIQDLERAVTLGDEDAAFMLKGLRPRVTAPRDRTN